jgi:predicted transcriptional regulator
MAVLDILAPDQRAVVGLVLQQGRSYQEIADLLGISRSAVRARAHAGLATLAPRDAEVPADEAAQLADFLLGQQDRAGERAARELIASSSDARMWANGVGERLREIAPDRVPDLAASQEAPRPRPRTSREEAPAATGAAPPRSSKLGGILLIAGAVLVVAAVLVFVVLRDDDDKGADSAAQPSATPTATATPRVVGQVPLTGVGSASKAKGTMTLFLVGQQLGFQIEGQDVPANKSRDRYAVWFTGPGSKADLIGVARDPVGSDGALGVSGPPTDNAQTFPQQLANHRQVLVSRETKAGAKQPGPIVLRGKLPSGS